MYVYYIYQAYKSHGRFYFSYQDHNDLIEEGWVLGDIPSTCGWMVPTWGVFEAVSL